MAQAPEPSMEEILSSIKRIISEDEPAPPRRAAADDDEDDVLELTDTVPEPQRIDAPAPEPAPFVTPDREALISAATAAASREALASLSKVTIRPETPPSDNTLEGLVRDLMRPLLREWLDANLPRIVQATVDREVARLSGL